MKIIKVDDAEVFIDDEDYDYIYGFYNLSISEHGYIYCSPKPKYRRMGLFSMSLHKILAQPEELGRNVVVDHKDGNKLNNTKLNLRVCTHQNNMQNRKVHQSYSGKEKSSIYKGVNWNKQNKKWNVLIKHENGQHEFLGYYINEEAAANVYNNKARQIFGEFALLNDVPFMDAENCEKYRSFKNKSSKYRGVSFVDGGWIAQLYHNGRNIRIGKYQHEKEAAIAYNEKAVELKGEKAKLNVI